MKHFFSIALLFLSLIHGTSSAFAEGKILVIISSATELPLKNEKVHPTGYFLGEFFEPITHLLEAGYDFDLATPGGIVPKVDKDSEAWLYWAFKSDALKQAQTFVAQDARMQQPMALEALSADDLANYDGLLIPGGHGPMVDLASNADLGEILLHFHTLQKPIGLICHSPVALLSLKKIDPWPFAGYTMTVFTNFEEKISERFVLGGAVPYYPQSELENLGAIVQSAKVPFTSNVVRDRELLTGQNPSSSDEFGRMFLGLLREVHR
jgi:putative intracellular protease/amidase